MPTSELTDDPQPGVAGDVVRALFVAVDGLLAFLLVAWTIAAAGLATAPRGPIHDTVMPTIDPADALIVGFAALVAVGGLIIAVRLWFRASWHVVTVTAAIWLAMLPFGWIFVFINFPH